jgi:hypothetical protein
MRKPVTLLGLLASAPLLREPGKRRWIFGVLIAICAILTLFPQKYRAAVSLTPTDPSALGLSGTLGQLGALNNVFGSQSAVEVSLKVARSQYVRQIVEKRLDLPRRLGKSSRGADRWLDGEMDIRALRGGIIQFEVKLEDPDFAKLLVGTYAEATREQLASVARNQTAYKRQILAELVEQASERLQRAQSAYDVFRLKTRYASPQQAILAAGDRIPELEGQIRSKQVELNAARAFGTDSNMIVRQLLAELDALKTQLAQVRSTSPNEDASVGRVVQASTEVDKLRRELEISQALYDNYKRFLQGTSVEDLTSTANVRVLEPAYVDTERQLNYIPLAIGTLLLMLAGVLEAFTYRPPAGEGVPS